MAPPVWTSPSKTSSVSSLSDNIVRRTCFTSDDVGSSSVLVFSAFKLAKKRCKRFLHGKKLLLFYTDVLFLGQQLQVLRDRWRKLAHSDFGPCETLAGFWVDPTKNSVFVWPLGQPPNKASGSWWGSDWKSLLLSGFLVLKHFSYCCTSII